jgi:hypothetical protein
MLYFYHTHFPDEAQGDQKNFTRSQTKWVGLKSSLGENPEVVL